MSSRSFFSILLIAFLVGLAACQRKGQQEKEDFSEDLPQYPAWLEIHRGDGMAWRSGTLLEFSKHASPPYEGETGILNPPGGEVYVTALFLGRNGGADRWQITIKPPATEPVVREVEYRDSFQWIWSDKADSVFICPPDKKPEPGKPVDWEAFEGLDDPRASRAARD
jgi:hypothetical protein